VCSPRRGDGRPTIDRDRRAHAGDRAAGGGFALKLDPHSAVDDLRIGEHVGKVVDRPSRNLHGLEPGGELRPLESRGEAEEMRDQLVTVAHPIRVGLVFRVLRQVRLAENPTQFGELAVVTGRDDDMAVGDREHLVGHHHGVRIAEPLRNFSGHEEAERLVGEHAHLDVQQRDVDVAAASGLFALGERRENADHRIDAAEDIGERDADPHRLAIRRSRNRHDPAHALDQQIIAGAMRIGPVLAKARDRAVDKTGVEARKVFIVEAELSETPDLEVLDQDVGARRQLAHDLAAFLGLEVHLDRALAAVRRVVIGGAEIAAIGGRHEGWPPAPRVVTRACSLDFDDLGAEVGEHLATPGPRQDAGKLEHAQTGQWTRHRFRSSHDGRARRPVGWVWCGLTSRLCLYLACWF
jgi:hypothetical protein